jgi:serine/threonine protein kinase
MADEDESDQAHEDTLDAMLREVARPPMVGGAALAHIHVPSTLELALPGMVTAVSGGLVAEPRPGEVLEGRWQLEQELGRGGMGVVYAARNLRTNKRVAIKWLATRGGASAEQAAHMVERFRREARAAAGIRHPNVVEVYDVGGPDDAPFLVMELLEGESLRTRLSRGPLSWAEACAIIIPVMRGVAAAHRAGVVHRDLKPDNLFLCTQDGVLVPKVLDFGVAAMKSGSSDGLASLTRSGTMVGTPSYMPLEQLMGKEVDERSDVYALGVVLYECLTGTLPFAARSASELAVLQATGSATPLSACSASAGGAQEAAVMKALAREPGIRYGSVEEFERRLEALRTAAALPYRAKRRVLVLSFIAACVLLGAVLAVRARSMLRGAVLSRHPDGAGPNPVPPIEASHEPSLPMARPPADADTSGQAHQVHPAPQQESESATAKGRFPDRPVERANPRRAKSRGAKVASPRSEPAQSTPRLATDIDYEDF